MAMTLAEELRARLRAGFTACGFDEAVLDRVGVGQSADLRFGDYQSNAAMVLAKEAKQNPRALAEAVIEKMDVADLAEMEIAGPGFLNFRVLPEAFAVRVDRIAGDEGRGVSIIAESELDEVEHNRRSGDTVHRLLIGPGSCFEIIVGDRHEEEAAEFCRTQHIV